MMQLRLWKFFDFRGAARKQPECSQNTARMQLECSQNTAIMQLERNQNAARKQLECNQNTARMQLVYNQNAARMQLEYSQNAARIQLACSQNAASALWIFSVFFWVQLESSQNVATMQLVVNISHAQMGLAFEHEKALIYFSLPCLQAVISVQEPGHTCLLQLFVQTRAPRTPSAQRRTRLSYQTATQDSELSVVYFTSSRCSHFQLVSPESERAQQSTGDWGQRLYQ